MHLDIQVGEHAIDYANVAQKEKLSELQLRVRQLLDQVEQITKEQNYQRVSYIQLDKTCRGSEQIKRHIQKDNLITFIFFSIARKDSGRQVKAQTKECCGGPLVKLVFLFSWGHGRCDISRVSLKRRNLCDFNIFLQIEHSYENLSSAIVLAH